MKIVKYPDTEEWGELLRRPVQDFKKIEKIVAPILKKVRKKGDKALRKFSLEYDQVKLKELLVSREEVEEAEDEAVEELSEEFVEKANAFIEDHIAKLDWEEMQQLVAGLLRAMGYRTTISDPGPDRGYDVFASPDGLGLEEPRIFAEVKHRKGTPMGSQDVRSFLGGRSKDDRCLYVSTGGFTREARYEADRSNVPLKLLTLRDLRRLLADYYETLDEQTRALVPLKQIYVLAD